MRCETTLALIEGVSFEALLGDKAFDADWLRADLDDRGAAAVIPPRSNRKAVSYTHLTLPTKRIV